MIRTVAYLTPVVAWVALRLTGLGPTCDPSGNICSDFELWLGSAGTVAFVVLWFTTPFALFLALWDLGNAVGRRCAASD